MNASELLFAASVMMAATALAIGVAKKLNLGSIVALLAVGIALGPHSPMPLLNAGVREMQTVGEIGVMLLLFAIGLGIQPSRLWSMRRLVFGLGAAQYLLTTAAILAFLVTVVGAGGVRWQSALVVSLGLAMSSAAIYFPILLERGETATAHGQAVVAIDIFQSFMVIPVLALIPLLSAGSAHGGQMPDHQTLLLQVVAALSGVFVLGRFILPRALALTARNLGPSGFPVVVLAAVFFAGWWMEMVGISMALGAFMIGVLLSTSSYAQQIEAAAAPTRRILLALFFIAIGMAIDLKELVGLKFDLLVYLPALLLIKWAIVFPLALRFRLGLRSAILIALLIMPFDEIAYVILASAGANGLISAREQTVGLSVLSLSFVVSPLLINLGYRLSDRLKRTGAPSVQQAATAITENALIVAGYGPIGRAICIVLERAHIPYTAFTLDLACLAEGERMNHNVHYGDLADPTLMSAVAIARARMVIVTSGDYDSTKRLLANLRQFYPEVPAMTGVRYLAQRDELRQMGFADVVALAPEGTLSFGRSILDRLGIAHRQGEAIIDSLKSDDYADLRGVGEGEPA